MIFVLFTFVGSTVRLFQTVGWLTVRPIAGLQLPPWTGLWFGLYPTWEGVLIPDVVDGGRFFIGPVKTDRKRLMVPPGHKKKPGLAGPGFFALSGL